MRLIDADRLKVEMQLNKTSYEISDVDERQNEVVDWCIKDVDNADTVEAIPIEWIEAVIEKYASYEYHVEIDDIEARWTLDALIEDWRAENGRSSMDQAFR